MNRLPLQLDDNYKITVDSSKQNFQLEKFENVAIRGTEQTKREWKIVGYFGSNLKSVLNKYKNEVLINSDFSTLDDVLDKLQEIDKTIEEVDKRGNIKLDIMND